MEVAGRRAVESSRPAARRYHADGRFATPLKGARSLPSILDIPVPAEVDSAQTPPPKASRTKDRCPTRRRVTGKPATSPSITRLEALAA